jgi:hypothetical protein
MFVVNYSVKLLIKKLKKKYLLSKGVQTENVDIEKFR